MDLDKVGTWASALCAVHCLVTGVALGLLSAIGFGFLGGLLADSIFLLVAIAVAALAIHHGRRRHGSILPALIFVAGLASLILGHFVFGHDHGNPTPAATAFSVLGGLCFVLFHVVNLRLPRTRACGCHGCGEVTDRERSSAA
jgi:hypothetical protein